VCFAYAILEEFEKDEKDLENSITLTKNPMTPIKNLASLGIARPVVFDLDW